MIYIQLQWPAQRSFLKVNVEICFQTLDITIRWKLDNHQMKKTTEVWKFGRNKKTKDLSQVSNALKKKNNM